MPVPWHTTTAKPTKPMVLVLVLVLVLLAKAIPLQMIMNPTMRCQRWRMEHTTTTTTTTTTAKTMVLHRQNHGAPLQMILNSTRGGQRWRVEHTTTTTRDHRRHTLWRCPLTHRTWPSPQLLLRKRRTTRHANTKQTQQDRRGQSNPDLTTRKKHFLLRRRGFDHRS
jgi:hypothetical protein